MQSGISASPDLHETFASFIADPSLFCFPVTIDDEQLVPGSPLVFVNEPNANYRAVASESDPDRVFLNSLPHLTPLLQPKTPIYLLLRRRSPDSTTSGSASESGSGLTAITYVPPDSPVRSKTLFASTRATLVRDLGSEKFADTVFAVDPADVLEPNAWRERDGDRAGSRGRDGETGGQGEEDEEEALTEHERQLREVRRQESEERSMGMGMGKRDTGVGGEVGGGADTALRLEDGLVDALLEMHAEEGKVVVLTIDVNTETFAVALNKSNISPADVPGLISNTKPQYTFYRYPDSSALLFIYTCPMGASIKERMLNASSRTAVLKLAQAKGVNITHKIEASGGDEITKERLDQEVNPPKTEAPTRGFARPKRPGR